MIIPYQMSAAQERQGGAIPKHTWKGRVMIALAWRPSASPWVVKCNEGIPVNRILASLHFAEQTATTSPSIAPRR